MITPGQLETVWQSIETPLTPSVTNGRRAPGLPPAIAAYLAVDANQGRHILIQTPEQSEPVQFRGIRGLQVHQAKYAIASHPEALYIDLECNNFAQYGTFATFAVDLLNSLITSQTSVRDTVADALARWLRFWSVERQGISRDEAVGLFGEIWFILYWLCPLGVQSVLGWQVTKGALHDIQWPQASFEVKASAAHPNALPIHRISSVDQLREPEQGELYLFSLHLREDELAVHTLQGLVSDLLSRFADRWEVVAHCYSVLASRGYTHGDAASDTPRLRVLGERLYHVGDGFPKITGASFPRGHVPVGVSAISYLLDTAACEHWLVADNRESERVRALLQIISG